ncbi:MAG: hypothetical protein LBK62_07110 [Treponema sp.]|nr:hypothetical protein [Treponema sp.]
MADLQFLFSLIAHSGLQKRKTQKLGTGNPTFNDKAQQTPENSPFCGQLYTVPRTDPVVCTVFFNYSSSSSTGAAQYVEKAPTTVVPPGAFCFFPLRPTL